ncbi:MAG: hypothetical protein M1827_002887 [Pycnora praestabilis]|nr:MAG: hypothetical protein M1827_002887 [Pycnora praestabilis]
MAPVTKEKKRKAVTEPLSATKKAKKSDETMSKPATKSSKKRNTAPTTADIGSEKLNVVSEAPAKASRKRAADFFDANDEIADADVKNVKDAKASKGKKLETLKSTEEKLSDDPPKKKKVKTVKDKPSGDMVEDNESEKKPKSKNGDGSDSKKMNGPKGSKAKSAKSNQPVAEEGSVTTEALKAKEEKRKTKPNGRSIASRKPEAVEEATTEDDIQVIGEADADDGAESAEDDIDDQTAALLKGFESSEDEGASDEQGFEKGQAVPGLPDDNKMRKKLKAITSGDSDAPGVVYVGRVPHGFYEHEMRAYFSQFGDIKRLRLSRNRKTGASKHYAFIEFKSSEVASIVADTMDNYLMFGHILKCKTVPKEQVHETLWKGANKRFKKVPWNKMQGRQLELGKTREKWDKKIQAERDNRKSKLEKMKEIGYEYLPPILKDVADVPKQEQSKSIVDATDDAALETTSAIKAGESELQQEPQADVVASIQESKDKKTKKGAKKAEKAKEDLAPVSNTANEPENIVTVEKTEPGVVTITESVKVKKAKKVGKTTKKVNGST